MFNLELKSATLIANLMTRTTTGKINQRRTKAKI